jgi:hypothetical protein
MGTHLRFGMSMPEREQRPGHECRLIEAAPIWEAMRRDFTAISGFSMAISFVAAVVLCLQITQIKAAPEWQISGATVRVVELAIFGTAVYAWRPKISLSGWILGILLLTFVSMSLTMCAALALTVIQGLGDFMTAMSRTSALVVRVCAAFFSLMVFYPVRMLLPIRRERKPDRKRFARSAAAFAAAAEGDPALVLVGGQDAIPVWETRNRPATFARDESDMAPALDVDGAIDLPLHALLAQIPRDMWGESANGYAPTHPVPVPLEVIAPQLKEARVVLRLGDLYELLPPGAMRDISLVDPGREDGLVLLPLELIVPQLPAEVLELPPPSPPAWANVDENESVLFATLPAK